MGNSISLQKRCALHVVVDFLIGVIARMAESGLNDVTLNTGPKLRPPRRYRIGELVQHTGLSRQTLHNYTQWGLIREVEWTAGGHRLYDEDAFDRLTVILQMKRTNTMDQIRERLDQIAGIQSA